MALCCHTRRLALGWALWALGALSASAAQGMERQTLRVATWGGAYEAAQRSVLFEPFTSRTGVAIEVVPLTGGLDEIRRALQAEPPGFDVADLPGSDAETLCRETLVDPLPPAALPAKVDGDFIVAPGRCGLPGLLAGEILVYDRRVLTSRTPASLSDLFDTTTFPGKRALRRDAQGALEWALLADGVPVRDIYVVLATQAGQDRAFARLDQIRADVMWWERGDAPLALLERGEVVMAAAYGARAYQAIAGTGGHYAAVWPGALVSDNRWVIARGRGTLVAAGEYVRFATDTSRQSGLAARLPYGPSRHSALATLSPEMRAYSPSVPEHLPDAILVDAAFWSDHGDALRTRFEAWLAAAP